MYIYSKFIFYLFFIRYIKYLRIFNFFYSVHAPLVSAHASSIHQLSTIDIFGIVLCSATISFTFSYVEQGSS